jgi:hypothetical protein
METSAQKLLGGLPFNWFDGILFLWLLLGLVRGRKNGMTLELLPLLQ